MDSLCLTGMHAAKIPLEPSCSLSCPPRKASASARGRFSFKCPLQSLWPPRKSTSVDGGGRYNGMALDDAVLEENAIPLPVGVEQEGQNGNWVLKILQVRSLWKENDDVVAREEEDAEEEEEEVQCEGCEEVDEDEDEEEELDMDSFSKSLKRVSLPEAKLYAQMSYLGNLAYCIPRMKAANLLRRHGLKFVTSSIDKRELAGKFDKKDQVRVDNSEADQNVEAQEKQQQRNVGYRISVSTAYHVAASAASYLHSHAKGILPTRSGKGGSESSGSGGGDGKGNGIGHVMNPEIASLMATTDSVTAVVAAKEEVKQAVADDLNSIQSSPCEWFICDDDQGARYFVIQGSEKLASWQANLLFEPVHFEGLDVPVHRGIYEAAKGMYEQMLPEVRAHLKSHGENATFRFTGHSLGGSLSLLLNLLLLIRGEVPASSLLPVITFGAPSVMCGGDHLLRKLGLPRSHVQAITMHRDIVPRVFSCNYPSHVAKILKAVNGSFRKHPCLNNQKLLYTPMGELLILQPDEKFSPHHHLLPEGSGLYFLSCPLSDATEAEKQLRAAQSLFLNSPHPLEILSDRSAYGSGGTIQRDHDMNSYLRCVRNVIRQDLNRMRKAKRENRRRFWWSILSPNGGSGSGVVVGRPGSKINTPDQNQFNLSGVIHTGRESIKRFTRLVASQHMQLLVVLLLPARLLLVGAYNVISFG